jgi:hypothetical protein
MIIRKHDSRQHNLLDVAKTSSWRVISEFPKLFEQTTYYNVEYLFNLVVNTKCLHSSILTTSDWKRTGLRKSLKDFGLLHEIMCCPSKYSLCALIHLSWVVS